MLILPSHLNSPLYDIFSMLLLFLIILQNSAVYLLIVADIFIFVIEIHWLTQVMGHLTFDDISNNFTNNQCIVGKFWRNKEYLSLFIM